MLAVNIEDDSLKTLVPSLGSVPVFSVLNQISSTYLPEEGEESFQSCDFFIWKTQEKLVK